MSFIPPELIESIILHLDSKTFFDCRQVCKAWYQIINRLLKDETIWKRFCSHDFPQLWESIYLKGKLSWSEIYNRIHIWPKIISLNPTLHSIKCSNNPIAILDLSVSRDATISVCLEDHVRFYNAIDLQPCKEIILGQYTKVFTGEFAEVLKMANHTLCMKTNNPHDSNRLICANNIDLVYTSEEMCYYLTLQQELYVHNFLHNDRPSIITKWFNSDRIISIGCYNKNLYLLTSSNKVLEYTNYRLEMRIHYRLPNCEVASNQEVRYLFRGPNLMYSNFRYLFIFLANGSTVQYETPVKISCLLLHGNTFIIGTICGQILSFSIKRIEDLLAIKFDEPSSRVFLKSFGSTHIKGIDVYEGTSHCSIICRTIEDIFVVKYEIPNKA